ncbi:hypothetical protein RDWZM_005033 [Blomia tropicalis]|uniref:Uncharacterized protein n=1 Tax=Blomia tropicalis TaxID=40697 RepID=A0A9Q0RN49_BLOTA|nr:hypothetical protein BLOT_005428 [Blomia tropicalis]KAJ6219221.1 hypothetical protein RDWZM_005033 [Blomia tropicalis]
MAEPIDMSKARNAYAKERDHFRRELKWVLQQYPESVPITFDIKQELRFRGADLKAACLDAYRQATKDIGSNQAPVIGSTLRIRSMASSEEFNRERLSRSKSPRSPRTRTTEDDEDIEEFISRNRASRSKTSSSSSSRYEPSVPISKMTYDAHRAISSNTHVLSFEHQLRDDIDVMISSIEQLTDQNRDNWLKIPRSDRTQYFSSRYDDTSYSVLPIVVNNIVSTPSSSLSGLRTSTSSSVGGTTSSSILGASENGLATSSTRSYFDRYLHRH